MLDASTQVAEANVLVIYSGGTIGMLVGDKGLVTEPSFLTDTLRGQYQFNDPGQDSLLSNVHSVEGYRAWSGSRTQSRDTSPNPSRTPREDRLRPPHTLGPSVNLLVKSCHPIGISPSQGARDARAGTGSKTIHEALLPSLVTPPSSISGQTQAKRIRYVILEVIRLYTSPLSC